MFCWDRFAFELSEWGPVWSQVQWCQILFDTPPRLVRGAAVTSSESQGDPLWESEQWELTVCQIQLDHLWVWFNLFISNIYNTMFSHFLECHTINRMRMCTKLAWWQLLYRKDNSKSISFFSLMVNLKSRSRWFSHDLASGFEFRFI